MCTDKKILIKITAKHEHVTSLENTNHVIHIWALMRENMSLVFASNKGTDQPAHRCSLMSTFVIHLIKSTISKLAAREISIF